MCYPNGIGVLYTRRGTDVKQLAGSASPEKARLAWRGTTGSASSSAPPPPEPLSQKPCVLGPCFTFTNSLGTLVRWFLVPSGRIQSAQVSGAWYPGLSFEV